MRQLPIFLSLAAAMVASSLFASSAARVAHTTSVNSGVIEGNLAVGGGGHATLQGQASIQGWLEAAGNPDLIENGGWIGAQETASGGTNPSNYRITVNGDAHLDGFRSRVDFVALEPVSAPNPPAGYRQVAINQPLGDFGDPATLRDLRVGEGSPRRISRRLPKAGLSRSSRERASASPCGHPTPTGTRSLTR